MIIKVNFNRKLKNSFTKVLLKTKRFLCLELLCV